MAQASLQLRVLLVTGDPPARFRALGSGGLDMPRHELCYPYYAALREAGCSVKIVRVQHTRLGSLDRAARLLHRADLAIAWSLAGPLLALAASRRGLSRKVVSVVYTHRSPRRDPLTGRLRDLLFARGLRLGGMTLYVTREQASHSPRQYRLPAERAACFQAGVDTEFWAPAREDAPVSPDVREAAREPFVVVSGDQQRDEQLVEQALLGTGLRLVRLTQGPGVQRHWEARRPVLDFGVFCRARLTFPEVRYLYQRALCVLNLADNSWQPAGLTVAKEALACATPLVMGRGLATRELLSHWRPCDDLPFVELGRPADPGAARAAVLRLRHRPEEAARYAAAGRALVTRALDIRRRAPALRALLESCRTLPAGV